ncbi:MAG TPA: alpha/beta hydrolase [Streptosporangiaceae bacterium]|nr:alpha/beta hydrolase [Streptosporangiaceae bacterium]
MSGQTPAIVLVHGAWADASGWSAVILRLQDDGFTVYAPPNPLRGLPQDADYLRDFLTQNPALAGQPVVLAGHSYGGAVVTNAATSDPRVRALVYVDAFIPDQDETIGQLAGAQPGSCLLGNPADIFDSAPYPGGQAGDVDLYIKQSLVPGCFANGLSPREAAVIAVTQRPLPASAFAEPSGPPAWKTIPSWAVIGTADQVIPPAELTFMAKRAGAQITEVNAGHLSMIADPRTVAEVIEQAAAATI